MDALDCVEALVAALHGYPALPKVPSSLHVPVVQYVGSPRQPRVAAGAPAGVPALWLPPAGSAAAPPPAVPGSSPGGEWEARPVGGEARYPAKDLVSHVFAPIGTPVSAEPPPPSRPSPLARAPPCASLSPHPTPHTTPHTHTHAHPRARCVCPALSDVYLASAVVLCCQFKVDEAKLSELGITVKWVRSRPGQTPPEPHTAPNTARSTAGAQQEHSNSGACGATHGS